MSRSQRSRDRSPTSRIKFGLKLFDRVGRRLLLTSEGEQLLSDCRGLLNYARALGEQAQVLRRGDVGVLRVAASPHLIEGIFPDLLSRYAERYPNVQVRLIDVVGAESFAMLERGEIHLTQTTVLALAGNEQRFAGYPLGPMEMLAACHPRLKLGKDGEVEIDRLAPYPLLQATTEFPHAEALRCGMPHGGVHAELRIGMPRAARAARHGRGGARRSDHSVRLAR